MSRPPCLGGTVNASCDPCGRLVCVRQGVTGCVYRLDASWTDRPHSQPDQSLTTGMAPPETPPENDSHSQGDSGPRLSPAAEGGPPWLSRHLVREMDIRTAKSQVRTVQSVRQAYLDGEVPGADGADGAGGADGVKPTERQTLSRTRTASSATCCVFFTDVPRVAWSLRQATSRVVWLLADAW